MRNLISCAMLMLSAAPAMAAPITYYFTGLINQVGSSPSGPVTVGQLIPIVITIDGAFPQTPAGSGHYNFSGGNPIVGFTPPIILATFDGVNQASQFQSISVSSFELLMSTATQQVVEGFALDVRGSFASIGGALPASIDQLSVTGGTFSVTEAFSPLIYGYSGTIVGAQAVPEPASAGLLGIGMLGIIVLSARPLRPAYRR